jgi:large conductance mechanosensitive channel
VADEAGKTGVWAEFKAFIEQANVITIAVGLVMALYTKAIVDAVLDGIIFPIISAVFSQPNIQNIGFDIGDARISVGLVIVAIINFFVVAFILFLIVKVWNKLYVKRAGDPTEVELLKEIRDELRRRP